MYPKNKKYQFSTGAEDPAFEKLGLIKVELDDSLVTDPIRVESLQDCLVLMDDVNSVGSKPLKLALMKLREQIVAVGRKLNVTGLFTAHKIRDYKQSAALLSGCTDVAIFPKSSDKRDCIMFMKDYCYFDSDLIDRIMTLPSRWVILHRYTPSYYLSEHEASVL